MKKVVLLFTVVIVLFVTGLTGLAQVNPLTGKDISQSNVQETTVNPLTGKPVSQEEGVNPLTGKTSQAENKATTTPPKSSNVFTEGFRKLIDLQKQLSGEIAKNIRAIKYDESRDVLWVALGIAFLYGVIHSVGPGHGKTIIATYFVSRDASILKGFLMGIQMAVVHVASAIVIVYVADVTLKQVLGNNIAQAPWIKLFSYLLITVIGGVMLYKRSRCPVGKSVYTCSHSHESLPNEKQKDRSWVVAFATGLIPCNGAILIMLYALANNMTGVGIALVSAIGVGIAVTISAVGILTIITRKAFILKFADAGEKQYKLSAIFEYSGAILISVIGIILLMGAIGEVMAL